MPGSSRSVAYLFLEQTVFDFSTPSFLKVLKMEGVIVEEVQRTGGFLHCDLERMHEPVTF